MRIRSCLSLMLLVGLSGFALYGCDAAESYTKHDRSTNLDFQDYRDALSPREIPQKADGDAGIPPMEPYVSDMPGTLRSMPLVSIAVNETVPLRDVLYELADQADFDIELDPRITGSIIFTARNRPFDQVIQRISDIAGLRYKFDDDSIRVELDTPYSKNYKLDYLPAVRTNTSSISTSVSVVSGAEASTGSSSSISSEAENNFWGDLETNLGQILQSNSGTMRTSQDPKLSAAPAASAAAAQPPAAPTSATTPPPSPVDAAAAGAAGADATVGEAGVAAGAPATPAAAPLPPALPVAASVASGDMTDSGGSAAGGNNVEFQPSFSINRPAGLIAVYANERMHSRVSEYLTEVRSQMTTQVLIEAKVLEVTLTDEYAAGINWSSVNVGGSKFQTAFNNFGIGPGAGGAMSPLPAFESATSNSFTLGYSSGDLDAVLQAISRYGTVRALASPRVTVLNNQPAILNVATNEVYFELDVETQDGTDTNPGGRITVDSQIRNVPVGVLINVLPSIDTHRNNITMQVRPTVTRIDRWADDPGSLYVIASEGLDTNLVSRIPVLAVQEIDSVLKMDSGQVVVMGGLMQERSSTTREGIPLLQDTPLIGGMFRTHRDSIEKTELVIFMKATIIKDGGVHQTDKDLYRVFSQDRRPSAM